jgi:hypothetical protein
VVEKTLRMMFRQSSFRLERKAPKICADHVTLPIKIFRPRPKLKSIIEGKFLRTASSLNKVDNDDGRPLVFGFGPTDH